MPPHVCCTTVNGLWQPGEGVAAAGAAGAAGGSLTDPGVGGSTGGVGGAAPSAGAGGEATAGGASGGAGGSGVDEPSEPLATTLAVDLNGRFQTLEGFGASVAWYGDWLTRHPHKAEIFDVVFRDLGLDILRLRNVYRDEPLDFDPVAVELVQAAAASLGLSPSVLLTSWTPPARLKANGDTECVGESSCTLRKLDGAFDYAGFADYWRDSLAAYAALGIDVDLVSIQNEPDFIPPSWEGCRFDAVEGAFPSYASAISEVRSRLTESELEVRLLGPEVIGLNGGKLSSYTAGMSPLDLDVVAHHLYDGVNWMLPDSFIPGMRAAAGVMPDKPIFQTEFSVPGGDGAFEIAWLIRNSLVEQGAAAYLHWDLIWTGVDGLVSLEDPRRPSTWQAERGYHVRDVYYSLQHFAKFTDPGDVRVEVESGAGPVKAVGFISPAADRLTITLLNTAESQPYDVALSIPGFAAASSASYRTSASERFVSLGAVGDNLRLPPRSLATLVLSR